MDFTELEFKIEENPPSPGCVELWREAFGDDEDHIRRFFAPYGDKNGEKNGGKSGILVSEVIADGETAAMSCILPCLLEYAIDGRHERRRGVYLYAMTVRETMRRRGIFRYLCDHTLEYCRDGLGAEFAMLIPSRAEYVAMYRSLGFTRSASGLFTLYGGDALRLDLDALRDCGFYRAESDEAAAGHILRLRRESGECRFSLPDGLTARALVDCGSVDCGGAVYFAGEGVPGAYIVAEDVPDGHNSVKIYDFCISRTARGVIMNGMVCPSGMRRPLKAQWTPLPPEKDLPVPTDAVADLFFEG